MCVSTAFGRIGQVARKVEGLVVRLGRGSSNLPGRIGKPRKRGGAAAARHHARPARAQRRGARRGLTRAALFTMHVRVRKAERGRWGSREHFAAIDRNTATAPERHGAGSMTKPWNWPPAPQRVSIRIDRLLLFTRKRARPYRPLLPAGREGGLPCCLLVWVLLSSGRALLGRGCRDQLGLGTWWQHVDRVEIGPG